MCESLLGEEKVSQRKQNKPDIKCRKKNASGTLKHISSAFPLGTKQRYLVSGLFLLIPLVLAQTPKFRKADIYFHSMIDVETSSTGQQSRAHCNIHKHNNKTKHCGCKLTYTCRIPYFL